MGHGSLWGGGLGVMQLLHNPCHHAMSHHRNGQVPGSIELSLLLRTGSHGAITPISVSFGHHKTQKHATIRRRNEYLQKFSPHQISLLKICRQLLADITQGHHKPATKVRRCRQGLQGCAESHRLADLVGGVRCPTAAHCRRRTGRCDGTFV